MMTLSMMLIMVHIIGELSILLIYGLYTVNNGYYLYC